MGSKFLNLADKDRFARSAVVIDRAHALGSVSPVLFRERIYGDFHGT